MTADKNIKGFENELKKVNRLGMDKLLAYIRGSDFYSAPASTRYHLSCEGGLLQHSLNVLDALRGMLYPGNERTWEYLTAGRVVCEIPDESVIIMALLHDLCKTHYYKTSTRNVKNEQTGKWEKAPFYTVEDKMPLGHGAKSAMLAMQFIKLTNTELYAIWHHMGFTEQGADFGTVGRAIELHPTVLALHTADIMASRFMEGESGNKEAFAGEAGEFDTDKILYYYHPESDSYWKRYESEPISEDFDSGNSVEISREEYEKGKGGKQYESRKEPVHKL